MANDQTPRVVVIGGVMTDITVRPTAPICASPIWMRRER